MNAIVASGKLDPPGSMCEGASASRLPSKGYGSGAKLEADNASRTGNGLDSFEEVRSYPPLAESKCRRHTGM